MAAFSSLNAVLALRPSIENIAMSSPKDGLGVVSNFSPAKMEFAPAIKQNACSEILISALPALRRTIVAGIRILAVAIMRTISQMSALG